MSALTKHAKLAVESWHSSYWALLIALDVFVLAICVFWNLREAFLPPVTIEELDKIYRMDKMGYS